MKIQSNWKSKAVCSSDKYHNKWLSYNIDDVEYAKDGCSRCTVRKECLITALQNDTFVGVIAGISEFDYLMHIWHEAVSEDESNWSRDDRVLSKLLQEAK